MSTQVQQPSTTDNNGATQQEVYIDKNEVVYDQEGNPKKETRKHKIMMCSTKFLPYVLIRALQFASSVITLGMTSFSRHSYGSFHTSKQDFAIAVSAISTFYLIVLFPILLFVRPYIIPAAILMSEVLLCILWLCAFIVLADIHGKHTCAAKPASNFDSITDNPFFGINPHHYLYYNEFLGEYTNKTYSSTCKTSKAAIAFAAFSFFLFLASSILFYLFVMNPITKKYGGMKKNFSKSNQIHVPGNPEGVQLHRGSGLILINEDMTENWDHEDGYVNEANADNLEEGDYQPETNPVEDSNRQTHPDVYEANYNTYSTQGSTVKSAGDDAFHEKNAQYQAQENNANTNLNDHQINSSKMHPQQITSLNSSANQGYTAQQNVSEPKAVHSSEDTGRNGYEIAGHSSKTAKAGTTGAGIVSKSDNQYGGYYNTDPIGDEVAGKVVGTNENEAAGDQPGIIQQAVDAGKKYMNVA